MVGAEVIESLNVNGDIGGKRRSSLVKTLQPVREKKDL